MRFILMHETNAAWEAGERPTPELIARVGAMMGELVQAGVLRDGAGLRASSLGVRLRFSGGRPTLLKGPLKPGNEIAAGFVLVNVASLEDAVAWATKLGDALGDVEIDVRPVNEPWDIGLVPRPEGLTTTRYMLLHKATAASEAGRAPDLAKLDEAMRGGGVFLTRETVLPTAKGARISREGLRDGPFAESKELLAGYAVVEAPSLAAAVAWGRKYFEAVTCTGVEVRELAG